MKKNIHPLPALIIATAFLLLSCHKKISLPGNGDDADTNVPPATSLPAIKSFGSKLYTSEDKEFRAWGLTMAFMKRRF